MRRPRLIGRRRKVLLRDLQVGMILHTPIRGYAGKVLVDAGEVLSLKHIEQIAKWDAREGEGKLSIYTRDVWAQGTDASGDERPKCDFDPYEAVSVQKNWKRDMGHALMPVKAVRQ